MRSRSTQRRLKFQQGEDYSFDMAGVDDFSMHSKSCGVWFDYDCDCVHSDLDNYMLYSEMEPPERVSKSAKPKMGMSGRSIKTVITRIIGGKAKKL